MREKTEKIMKRVAGGESSSFEEIVRRYRNYVLNVIYKFFGRADGAEDLAQDVFLKVFRAAENYTPSAKFSTYLYRVTANLCMNRIRDERRRRGISLDDGFDGRFGDDGGHAARIADDRAMAPGESLFDAELAEKVKDALDALPDKQRLAVIFYRYEDMSYREIAGVLGTTVPAVKSLIFRARAQLADMLGPYVKE